MLLSINCHSKPKLIVLMKSEASVLFSNFHVLLAFTSLSVSIVISPFRLIAFSDVSYGLIILAFSQVVNREIKNFSKKFCEGGEKLVNIICTKSKCLNNKGGKCIANEIYYDGLCQTYCTSQHASKQHAGICQRSHGRMKSKDNNILR